MSRQHPRRRRWPVILLLVAIGIAAGFAALMYWYPTWPAEQSLEYFMYTHGVRQHTVPVGKYNIHYLEAKPRGAGPDQPIILIHGLGARATNWAPVIPQLAAAGYHVYAIDLLGYGDSPKPGDGDYTLNGEERIVLGFLQALNLPQADIAGWSMGGWVAMKIALDQPQRIHRLLLYDTAGLYFTPDFPLSLFAPTNNEEFHALIRQIEPDKPFVHIPDFAVHGMLHRMRPTQPIIIASFRSMLTGRELLDFRVHRLKMPVLIVWGAEDKLIPMSVGLRLHELVPQSTFIGIGGCGHLAVNECASQAIPATLKWLRTDPPPPPSTTFLPSLR